LENLFKDFPEKQNEMMKWISNYSAEKQKVPPNPGQKDLGQPDEWRKKRNSLFVSDMNHSKILYMETLIPANVKKIHDDSTKKINNIFLGFEYI